MMKIVLTGGGTAGHVVPCIALLPHLKKNFDKIHYIGSHTGIEKKIVAEQTSGVAYHHITTAKLRRSFDVRNLLIPFKLVKGISEAKRILKEIKPNVVFSKGGFVAYPVVRAAAKLGIPVVAHESDITMGLANRLCAKHCTVICTTFKKTACQPKMIYTGSPLRAEIYNGIGIKIQRRHSFTNDKGNLLIFGGSLGAAKINETVRNALGKLDFNIVHICGKGKTADIVHKNYIQLEFAGDIQNYFAWADVVVARAGSNSVCELLALRKPTLFIPLATGRGDQIENAKEILNTGAAEVLFEKDLSDKSFVEYIKKVYKDRERYTNNAVNMGEIDGTKQIAEIIVKNVKKAE